MKSTILLSIVLFLVILIINLYVYGQKDCGDDGICYNKDCPDDDKIEDNCDKGYVCCKGDYVIFAENPQLSEGDDRDEKR